MTKVTHLTLDEEGGLNRRRIHLREISGDADAPLETVGQDLRAARLRRGDDLATVSRALKIRKDHLEALEEDRLDALPGRTYAVGFVRTYADFLGLDALQMVERFKAEIAGRESGPTPVSGLPAHEEERKLPHGWMIIAVIVVGLVLFGIYRLLVSADRMLTEPVAPVPASIAPKQPVHFQKPPAPHAQAAPATEVAGKAAPIIPPVRLDGPPAQPATTAPTPQTAAATPATQTPATAPAPAADSPPTQTATATQTAAEPQTTGQIFGQENSNARVILHVLRVTRVLVQGSDGKLYINRTLHPGDTYRVPDFVGLTLTTPDGGAVQVELDGQIMGTAGKPSEIVEAMSLDPQSVVDRMNN
jgi:cytoskeleton protein RodZ